MSKCIVLSIQPVKLNAVHSSRKSKAIPNGILQKEQYRLSAYQWVNEYIEHAKQFKELPSLEI